MSSRRPFTGSEPLVGEVIALRTFRVDESGLLLPLYSDRSWYDGVNCATCAPPTGERERSDHQVASPTCDCGFYAFGTPEAANRYRNSRYVQAVVSCWGSVVAGTQGVRAERARIVAIWLGSGAPAWLVKRVGLTYPSARIYADRVGMLTEHPLSVLPCYEPAAPPRLRHRLALPGAGAVLVGLGLMPSSALHGVGWDSWLAVSVALTLALMWLTFFSRATGHAALAVLMAGALAWFAAPLFGLGGWLLRLPALRAAGVAAAGYLAAMRPGYFPIVRAPQARRFRGVVV